MGRWTLAHTEALCSEKFQAALEKPLSQSGLKLEEFFEAFDPQDLVVQKLIGALVNDIVIRRKSPNRTPCSAVRVSERCAEASFYINYRATDAHPHPPYSVPGYHRSRSSTIRARRRAELYGGALSTSEMPWRTSYSSWSPDADDFVVPDEPSPPLIPTPYQPYIRSSNDAEEVLVVPQPPEAPAESSGEYWWRAAMQGHTTTTTTTVGGGPSSASLSASPTPFAHERSPSPRMSGYLPWSIGLTAREQREQRRRRLAAAEAGGGVVVPIPPPIHRTRSSSLPPATSDPNADHLVSSQIVDGSGEPLSLRLESPPYTPIPDVTVRSPDLEPYQPTNVEVFRFDQGPIWARSPSPMPSGLPSPQPGPTTTVTVEDSLWR